jgi:hypothetical protein
MWQVLIKQESKDVWWVLDKEESKNMYVLGSKHREPRRCGVP